MKMVEDDPGHGHLQAETHILNLSVSAMAIARHKRGALIYRGANGGILGNDAKVILEHLKEVDVVTGSIDGHEIPKLRMVDASAVIQTQKGPVIGIFRQYANHGLSRTIHSARQFEFFNNKVDYRSMKCGGTQEYLTIISFTT